LELELELKPPLTDYRESQPLANRVQWISWTVFQ
jgi:hypothetical protein